MDFYPLGRITGTKSVEKLSVRLSTWQTSQQFIHFISCKSYEITYEIRRKLLCQAEYIYFFFSSCVVLVWFDLVWLVLVWFCWVWYEFGAFNSICAYTYYLTIVNVFSCSICFKSNGILFVFVRVGGTNKMPQSTDVQIKTRTSFLKWSKTEWRKTKSKYTLSANCTEIEWKSDRVIDRKRWNEK